MSASTRKNALLGGSSGEVLNIILLAFLMMQAQRNVPLSFACGERVRDDT